MDNELAVAIGARIREIREREGLSQADFAKELEVSPPAISQIEAGKRTPVLGIIIDIADKYRVTTDFLLRGVAGEGADGSAGIQLHELQKLSVKEQRVLRRVIETFVQEAGKQTEDEE